MEEKIRRAIQKCERRQCRKSYRKPTLKKHKPLRKIVLLTGAVVGSSAATFGVT